MPRSDPVMLRRNGASVMRPVLFLVGWCFFGLGAVGIVVPGLPTVPFMLVALWLFSKSSRRFHDWLYGHSMFGPPLQQWHAHGVVASVDPGITVVTALVMIIGAIYILRQPSRAPE
jgi:uncharacterized membrane protein YbaN (DUF454 family)